MRNVLLVCIALFAFGQAGSCAATSAAEGLAAYHAGRYAKALHILQPLAREGDAQAQYLLGVMRERGHGVARDAARAAYWYELSAAGGHYAPACWRLALLYRDGRGVSRDLARARSLLEEAVARGSEHARAALAALPKTGTTAALKPPASPAPPQSAEAQASDDDVPQALRSAVARYRSVVQAAPRDEAARQGLADAVLQATAQWFAAEALEREAQMRALAQFITIELGETGWRLAQMAKHGDANAHAALGMMHSLGIVVTQNAVQACGHYVEAARVGHVVGSYHAALCAPRESAQEAAGWLRTAAQGNHAIAQELLARACIESAQKDLACARRWLEPAAQAGRPAAMVLLAWVIRAQGSGSMASDQEALRWYARAAGHGNRIAMNNLGECYEQGRGIEADAGKAASWYAKAAEAGLPAAQYNLGRLLWEGGGVPQDRAAGEAWLRRAASGGVPQAEALLAKAARPM